MTFLVAFSYVPKIIISYVLTVNEITKLFYILLQQLFYSCSEDKTIIFINNCVRTANCSVQLELY